MNWPHDVAYFASGLFLSNAVPHYVCGVTGRPFQTPFASPPGKGLSSSRVNVLWGCINLAMGYLLVTRIGNFDGHALDQAASLGLGVLLMGLFCAHHFGQFHGGNSPVQL